MSSDANPPRRFKPQLVDESTTSSKKPKRFSPEPISTTTQSARKIPPEDPQPLAIHIEDVDSKAQELPKETPKTRRRFAVEPVEVSSRTSRRQADEETAEAAGPLMQHEKLAAPPSKSRRKFKPDLIETAKRSRRSGDTIPTVLPADKTNASPDDVLSKPERPSPLPVPPANTPSVSQNEVPSLKPAPTRQGSMKPHNNTRTNTRQHSFKVPSLPDIESSESDKSNLPSLSPSQGSDSDTSDEAYKDRTRIRESVDEDVSGYLLALAAKAADRQLRDQEAAAFVNTDYHEPVSHYMNRSDSEDESNMPTVVSSRKKTDKTRRDSGDEKAELKLLQKHGERVAAEGKAGDNKRQLSKQNEWNGRTAETPFGGMNSTPKKYIGGYQKCPDLKQMRKAASPPMLGGDIDFPRCPSPEHARFDVTQGSDYLRRNMCYLSEQSTGQSGLWGQRQQTKTPDRPPDAVISRKATDAKSRNETGNEAVKSLWGGLCSGKDDKRPPTPTGLVTPMMTPLASPAKEKEDPFAKLFSIASQVNAPARPRTPAAAPPTPPTSSSPRKEPRPRHLNVPSATAIDSRLQVEARIEAEFDDAFVTQVYNYLSFGYPALARKFDEELSRVAKVSVPELREDDKLAEARGYVRLGDSEVDGVVRGLEETRCRRWRALRRYVKEWGRQMINKEGEEGGGQWGVDGYDPHRAWGLPARRGSWGL